MKKIVTKSLALGSLGLLSGTATAGALYFPEMSN